MENEPLKVFIQECTDTIIRQGEQNPLLYEVFFFKIYVKFEHLLSVLFEMYAVGEKSCAGYCPERRLHFVSTEHLRAILQPNGNRINYGEKISSLSSHIFANDPFSIIYEDSENNNLFNQMIALRNYIAHESPESKLKYIRTCLSNGRYMEPYEFLRKQHRNIHKSYYTIYVNKISDVSDYLLGVTPDRE